jgi:hypothetical protein
MKADGRALSKAQHHPPAPKDSAGRQGERTALDLGGVKQMRNGPVAAGWLPAKKDVRLRRAQVENLCYGEAPLGARQGGEGFEGFAGVAAE